MVYNASARQAEHKKNYQEVHQKSECRKRWSKAEQLLAKLQAMLAHPVCTDTSNNVQPMNYASYQGHADTDSHTTPVCLIGVYSCQHAYCCGQDSRACWQCLDVCCDICLPKLMSCPGCSEAVHSKKSSSVLRHSLHPCLHLPKSFRAAR